MKSIFQQSASPKSPEVLQPARNSIDISIADAGRKGMPVITLRSAGATLHIGSVKQESGNYIISAEKKADNVAVIYLDEKA